MPATPVVSYTSIERIYIRLPDLGSITTLTSAHIATFAGDAESEINAAIAPKYTLPISGDVPLLTTLATEIAVYKVVAQRLFTPERLAASPWPDRFREAQARIDQIVAGSLVLVTTSGEVIAGRTDLAELWTTTKNYKPTFWEGPRGTDVIDPTKVEDEGNARDFTDVRDRLL